MSKDTYQVLHKHNQAQWDQAVRDVQAELHRAEELHPGWPSDPIHGAAIVAEEAGEVVQAALQSVYESYDREHLREELIQTAAMALRMVMFVDAHYPEVPKCTA